MRIQSIFQLQAVLLCTLFSSFSSATQFPFPEIEVAAPELRADFLRPGAVIELGNILRISPDLTSEEVEALLGAPASQLEDGNRSVFFYNFLVSLNGTGSELVCQYRVVFEENLSTEKYGWRREICRDQYELLYPLVDYSDEGEVILESDLLFDFDSYSITANGLNKLKKMSARLHVDFKDPLINIVGHTDRFGSDEYNQLLSQQRSSSVRRVFIDQGLDAGKILTEGRGESEPLIECEGDSSSDVLKECLAPNRRVQVQIMEYPGIN